VGAVGLESMVIFDTISDEVVSGICRQMSITRIGESFFSFVIQFFANILH
jgi:hypothetical protein